MEKTERIIKGLPLSEYKKKYYQENKEKIRKYMLQHYHENRERITARKRAYYHKNKEWIKEKRGDYFVIHQFLHGHNWAKTDGLLGGDGMCLFYGKIFPLFLLTHHPFGRQNNDFTITVCGDCHRFVKRMGQNWVDLEWIKNG